MATMLARAFPQERRVKASKEQEGGYEYLAIHSIVVCTMESCFSLLTFAFSLHSLYNFYPTTSLVLFECIEECFNSSGYADTHRKR